MLNRNYSLNFSTLNVIEVPRVTIYEIIEGYRELIGTRLNDNIYDKREILI